MQAVGQQLAEALTTAAKSGDWRALLDWVSRDGAELEPEVFGHARLMIEDLEIGSAAGDFAGLDLVVLSPAGQVLARRQSPSRLEGLLGEPAGAEALAEGKQALARGAKAAFVDLTTNDQRLYAILLPAHQAAGAWSAISPQRLARAGETVLIAQAQEDSPAKWTSMQTVFGLTPAEVRLAKRLEAGETLREAANGLGVSINTIRAHLRALFGKVGVRRQAELVLALKQFGGLLHAVGPAAAPTPSPRPKAGAPQGLRLYVAPDGRRIAYREYGAETARPVLGFHDSLGSSLAPSATDDLCRDLGLRLILPDRPGFGQSDPAPSYGFAEVADDLLDLCAAIGADRPRFLGLASGGGFALAAAQAAGKACDLTMLVSARGPGASLRPPKSFLQRYRRELLNSPWFAETMLQLYARLYSQDFVTGSLRRTTADAAADRAFLAANPDVPAYITARGLECLARGARGPAGDLAAYRTRQGPIPPLPGAVVVWHGEADTASPLDQLLASVSGPVELRTFPQTGHLLALMAWPDVLKRLAEPAEPI
jgi:pimeloyl-ACP methyl ester carboxylesterase/DNA-binding CsgD family transcriptional regulator